MVTKKSPRNTSRNGLDVVLDLVAVLGLGDQHPGEEGAERQRQPRHLGDPREAERHQQHEEDEEPEDFCRATTLKRGRISFWPRKSTIAEHHAALRSAIADGARDLLRRAAPARG
jgi:hypothetical protein